TVGYASQIESISQRIPKPLAALTWQHVWQSTPYWGTALGLVAFALLTTELFGHKPGEALVSGLWGDLIRVTGYFAASVAPLFLGASAFGSDNQQRRMLFLADRGIPTASIWWTRQMTALLGSLILIGL